MGTIRFCDVKSGPQIKYIWLTRLSPCLCGQTARGNLVFSTKSKPELSTPYLDFRGYEQVAYPEHIARIQKEEEKKRKQQTKNKNRFKWSLIEKEYMATLVRERLTKNLTAETGNWQDRQQNRMLD
jgi:hypothetical protein